MTMTDEPTTETTTEMPDSNRVALPGGEWVVLNDVNSIRQKDRKAVMASIDRANAEGGANVGALTIADRIAGLVVKEWSFHVDGQPLAIPRDRPDAMDELPIPAYDAIMGLCDPFMTALFPDFTPGADESDNGSRQGPTGTSSDSAGT